MGLMKQSTDRLLTAYARIRRRSFQRAFQWPADGFEVIFRQATTITAAQGVNHQFHQIWRLVSHDSNEMPTRIRIGGIVLFRERDNQGDGIRSWHGASY